MEPPVAAGGNFEGNHFVLEVIFSNVHVKAVRRKVVQRLCGLLLFLSSRRSVMAEIAVVFQFLPDFLQILFVAGDLQRCRNALEMLHIRFCALDPLLQRFCGALKLVVTVKIFLCVLCCSHRRIQRNRGGFVVIIIDCFQFLRSRCQTVSISIQQFSVNAIFLPLFGIMHLFFLKLQGSPAALQTCLNNLPQINGTLPDPGPEFLLRVILFQQ